MPNHIYLIFAPASGEAHRRYAAFVNARAPVSAHLFLGRYNCVEMDQAHTLNALR